MKPKSPLSKPIPIKVVGSTQFGRYPKISVEKTFNMIISDDFLVDYAGYETVATISPQGEGRGLFVSTRLGKMITVINNTVHTIDDELVVSDSLGKLTSFVGDVSIAENNANQIAICDGTAIYIYNYSTGAFEKIVTDFIPGYVCFQNGYFIASVVDQPLWRLSELNDGTSWPEINPDSTATNVGQFEVSADNVVACIPVPGKTNLLFVIGKKITIPWDNTGEEIFPYSEITQFNIDYGTPNAATIAFGDEFVIWFGSNAKSGPAILLSEGGPVQQLSDEGYNYRFSRLAHPEKSTAFLFKQDGHLIYQLTFYHPDDNFSLIYDFSTKQFFSVSDEKMNFHIARRMVFFNNKYYFVSLSDGNLYEMSTDYQTYDGQEIPRVRQTNNIRLPDNDIFIVENFTMLLEQGNSRNPQAIDVSFSINGGESFSNYVRYELNELGYRKNRFDVWGLGAANDFVLRLNFIGKNRFVVGNGQVSLRQ